MTNNDLLQVYTVGLSVYVAWYAAILKLFGDCNEGNNAWGYLKYYWLLPSEDCCVGTPIKFHVKLEKYPATVSEVFNNYIWGIIAKKV